MEENITVQIPRNWVEGFPQEELTLQQIFLLGLKQYKIERALQFYRDGVGSLGYIAERVGLDKRDLMREARLRDMEPEFSEETVQEELA